MSSSTKLVRPVIDLCLFFYLFQFFYIQNFFIFIYLFLSSIHISHKCSNQTSEGGGVDLADVAVRKLDKLNNYKLGIIDHKDKYKYKHWSKYTYIPVENKYELNCNKYLGIFSPFIGMYSFSISINISISIMFVIDRSTDSTGS